MSVAGYLHNWVMVSNVLRVERELEKKNLPMQTRALSPQRNLSGQRGTW